MNLRTFPQLPLPQTERKPPERCGAASPLTCRRAASRRWPSAPRSARWCTSHTATRAGAASGPPPGRPGSPHRPGGSRVGHHVLTEPQGSRRAAPEPRISAGTSPAASGTSDYPGRQRGAGLCRSRHSDAFINRGARRCAVLVPSQSRSPELAPVFTTLHPSSFPRRPRTPPPRPCPRHYPRPRGCRPDPRAGGRPSQAARGAVPTAKRVTLPSPRPGAGPGVPWAGLAGGSGKRGGAPHLRPRPASPGC